MIQTNCHINRGQDLDVHVLTQYFFYLLQNENLLIHKNEFVRVGGKKLLLIPSGSPKYLISL